MSGSLVYGSFTDYLETKLLAHVFMNTPYTPPEKVYAALFTTQPSDSAPGAEPGSSKGYARVEVPFVAGPEQDDGSGSVWNNTLLQFPLATAYWGTVGWGGLFDAPTGGNLLVHGPLVESRTVNGGEVLRFPINDLLVALG